MTTTEAVSSPQAAPVADDPYEQYLAKQKETESQWDVKREAKQAKVHAEEVAADVATLRQQLEAKTIECHQLSSKLDEVEKQQMRAQENLCEVCTLRLFANNSSSQNSFHHALSYYILLALTLIDN